MNHTKILLSAVALSLITLCGAAPAADGPVQFQKLLDDQAPSIVTLKYILKGGDQDEEAETLGVVIESGGLVLTSNNAFGGLMARMGGPSQTPTEIKVLIGDDTQGLDATFLARDSELQLAWVQLKTPPAKPLTYVDFEKGASAKLGDLIYIVGLMGKFFDRAPLIAEGRIGAATTKPRELLIPSVGLAGSELGMPVFNAAGKPVGVTTLIIPDQDEVQGSPGGMRAAMRGIVTGAMILPAAEVAAATKRAKETAANAPAEATPSNTPAAEPGSDPSAPGKTEPEQPK
ncbi:MAG: trypsin-like peptidase domain-containing protein [Phycisphaerae bacterium]|nr:trypsin-like peptidase domain-containing protein [Phycisphaerae bacterium]